MIYFNNFHTWNLEKKNTFLKLLQTVSVPYFKKPDTILCICFFKFICVIAYFLNCDIFCIIQFILRHGYLFCLIKVVNNRTT